MGAGRHQQDRDAGESGRVPLFAPEIPPVHDGHQEVEQDQVAAPLAVSELPQGLGTVRRAERVVAGILQNGRDRIEGVGIVLDDQDDPAGAGGPERYFPFAKRGGSTCDIACKVVAPLWETRRSITFVTKIGNQESP